MSSARSKASSKGRRIVINDASCLIDLHKVGLVEIMLRKRDFPRTLAPAVLMDCPSIGRYRAVQAVAALWKLKGSRSVPPLTRAGRLAGSGDVSWQLVAAVLSSGLVVEGV
jgi:hypothetical protein